MRGDAYITRGLARRPLRSRASGRASTSTPATPTTILANLLIWIDPATAYCAVSGGKITSFTNRGSLGGTITQATASAQAVRNAADTAFNNLASFAGDGLGTTYTLPDLSALTQGEVFAVMVKAADPSVGSSGVWSKFGTFGQTSYVPYTDGLVYECCGSSSERPVNGDPTPSLASPFLYNVWSASADYGIKINGTVFYTRATNTVGFLSAPTMLEDVGLFMAGSMCMLFVCGSKQTPAARAAMEQWVKTTCGISSIP